MTDPADAEAILAGFGDAADAAIDLGEAALALAALDRPRVPLERYRAHLGEIAAAVAARAGADPDAGAAVDALNGVIAVDLGYEGDRDTYDDLQNANLIRVIDRRKGLPVALGILYLRTAQALGWEAAGLAFPGHFVIAVARGPQRIVLDPFHQGRRCGAPELRRLLKSTAGAEEELAPHHYAPVGNRAVLLRLENNIKLRRLQQRDAAGALRAVRAMLLFAPGEAALWHEAGLLHVHVGEVAAAVDALEHALATTDDVAHRHRLAVLIQETRRRLN
jgi:regulator of sirC expression with transglutaminase-like and TPR domain